MRPECIVTSLPKPCMNYLRRLTARPFNGKDPIRARTPQARSAPKAHRDAAVAATAERSGREAGLSVSRLPIRFSRPDSGYKRGPTRTLDTADLT